MSRIRRLVHHLNIAPREMFESGIVPRPGHLLHRDNHLFWKAYYQRYVKDRYYSWDTDGKVGTLLGYSEIREVTSDRVCLLDRMPNLYCLDQGWLLPSRLVKVEAGMITLKVHPYHHRIRAPRATLGVDPLLLSEFADQFREIRAGGSWSHHGHFINYSFWL